MPSPRMPGLAARGAEDRPLALGAARVVAVVGVQPARAAVEPQPAPAGRLDLDAGQAADRLLGRGLEAERRRPGGARGPCRSAPLRAARDGSQPSREASQPTSSSAAASESGWWRIVTRADRARGRAAAARDRTSRRCARATGSSAARRGRRRRRARASVSARPSASSTSGSSTESSSTTWAWPQQRVDRLVVAVGRPDDGGQVGDDERVDDPVEVREVALAAADRSRSRTSAPARVGPLVVDVGDELDVRVERACARARPRRRSCATGGSGRRGRAGWRPRRATARRRSRRG